MGGVLSWRSLGWLFLGLVVSVGTVSHAATTEDAGDRSAVGRVTGYPLPRFVTLRSAEVNLRTGPGVRYPIVWIYRRKGLPVEIIEEFGTWRMVRDVDGDEGWVHESLLAGSRAVILRQDEELRGEPVGTAAVTARAKAGHIAPLESCVASWCRLSASGAVAWIEEDRIWGVRNGETYDD